MSNNRHLVFQIQHYSLHDGPGIRTIVFLKGCPLRCRWCCNPESQSAKCEISFDKKKCIGIKQCGFCLRELDVPVFSLSELPKKAAMDCPAKALKIEGSEYKIDEILDIVEKDSVFYEQGNGGLTLSGGEPLMHKEFLVNLLKEAKERHIHTTIETCGYADYEVLYEAAKYLDYILFDIKSLDEEKHIQFTGKSNKKILANFDRLCIDYPNLKKKVRTPVIPGFNDKLEDMEAIVRFVSDHKNVDYEPLKYHKYGEGKYTNLGRIYPMGDARLEDGFMEKVNSMVAKYIKNTTD